MIPSKQNRDNWQMVATASLLFLAILAVVGYFFHTKVLFWTTGISSAVFVIINIIIIQLTVSPVDRLAHITHVLVFLPLIVIGCLIDKSMFEGIILGFAFMGLAMVAHIKLTYFLNSLVRVETNKWLQQEFGEDTEKENLHSLEPIVLDEDIKYEPDRVKSMSNAYKRISNVMQSLEQDMDILEHNTLTIESLIRYEESGLRKKDHELENSGEIYVHDDFLDVLEDGAICDMLSRAKDIRHRMSDSIEKSLNSC